MVYLVALASSALYGAADFLGGLASRRASTAWVVATSQASGLMVLLLAIAILPPTDPHASDMLWGGGAGLAGALGIGLLYRALAIGTMGVVAPITAVCAVALPVFVSLARGQVATPMTLAGIGLAVVAIVLVSGQGAPGRRDDGLPDAPRSLSPGVPHAIVSGIAIGVFYVLMAESRQESGLWPLVGARGVAAPVCVVAGMLSRGASVRAMPRPAVLTAAGAGVVDMTANVLYLLASRMGSLAVVVTLSSLYPASTVALARMLLGERLHRLQVIGMVCALVAVALIVAGNER